MLYCLGMHVGSLPGVSRRTAWYSATTARQASLACEREAP